MHVQGEAGTWALSPVLEVLLKEIQHEATKALSLEHSDSWERYEELSKPRGWAEVWTPPLVPAGMVWLFPAAHTDWHLELERAGHLKRLWIPKRRGMVNRLPRQSQIWEKTLFITVEI